MMIKTWYSWKEKTKTSYKILVAAVGPRLDPTEPPHSILFGVIINLRQSHMAGKSPNEMFKWCVSLAGQSSLNEHLYCKHVLKSMPIFCGLAPHGHRLERDARRPFFINDISYCWIYLMIFQQLSP